jgi:hypothetical protein
MEFLTETQNIIKLVEEKSGQKVEVIPDSSLSVLARVKMAKGDIPFHVISYNPHKGGVDYHIAYECGFILRLLENLPEERYQFAGSVEGKKAVQRTVSANKQLKRMGLPPEAIKQVANQLFDGLMTQLRSLPIGLRIDRWLWDDYPGLRELQKTSIAKQQQDNVQALGPQIRAMAPIKVFAANASMNAAYALFCDRLLGKPLYFVPYRSAGFQSYGERLVKIWDDIPVDGTHDREMVDAWARELEIEDWYTWVKME